MDIQVQEEGGLSQFEEQRPITVDGQVPQKRFYRTRAHCNPLSHNESFDYPRCPQDYDWEKTHFPTFRASLPLSSCGEEEKSIIVREREGASTCLSTTRSQFPIDFIDVGCGFGGLTIALAKHFPEKVVLALEIRAKVAEYVRLRIQALRAGTQTEENRNDYKSCEELFGVKRKRQGGISNFIEEEEEEEELQQQYKKQKKEQQKEEYGDVTQMEDNDLIIESNDSNKDTVGVSSLKRNSLCHNATCMKLNAMKYLKYVKCIYNMSVIFKKVDRT